jgi:arylsulfatase A-like enzyme
MADDLGYGHLGCYGQKKIATPQLDRLAAGGMRFTQFYAGSAVCAPSRSVLMQGLHSGHSAIRANGGGAFLLDDEVTLAEVLKAAGYVTGGFGKWGLGIEGTPGAPYKQGFDEFHGFYHQVHAHFYYPYWIWHNDRKVTLAGNINRREQYVDDVLQEKARGFIRDNARKKQPFFCYIPTIIPHVELTVPDDSAAPYRGKFPKLVLNDPRTGYIGSDDAYADYAGMVSRLDRNVGLILDLLDELGIADDTLVLFTSDNGPQMDAWQVLTQFFNGAGPFRAGKGSLHEGGLRVPFIVRWPGRIPPHPFPSPPGGEGEGVRGATSEHVAAFQDLMPTLAEIAGAKTPRTDGISMLPTLLGKSGQKEHAYLYWELGKQKAVRMRDWKAVKVADKDWLLFDLSKDIGETRNVAGENPAIVARIEEAARSAHTPPRPLTDAAKVGIANYVRDPRITQKNAR